MERFGLEKEEDEQADVEYRTHLQKTDFKTKHIQTEYSDVGGKLEVTSTGLRWWRKLNILRE